MKRGLPSAPLSGRLKFPATIGKDLTIHVLTVGAPKSRLPSASVTMGLAVKMCMLLLIACLALSPARSAELFPLEDVRAGMRGTGRTVFSGQEVEEFAVEILGVLENVGPKQSIILGRLSGGPLEETGVMAGMSGSPVYLEGKLAGAVAYSFPFTTEAIAGIRPIHEMIAGLSSEPASPNARIRIPFPRQPENTRLFAASGGLPEAAAWMLPPAAKAIGTEPRLAPVATPVNLAGFSERTLDVFGPHLRKLGLRPMQGVAGGSRTPDTQPGDAALEPGSMITVALIQGDMEVSAAGTVTHIDGDRVYAFGHRFLSAGPTQLPFSRSNVITVVPSLSSSFKIAGSGTLLGSIVNDQSSGIVGRLGQQPKLVPVRIKLASRRTGEHHYALQLVNDRYLTPYLLQMAVFSAIDASERQAGASTLRVSGAAEFGNGVPALKLDDVFSGSYAAPLQLATSTAVLLYYALESNEVSLERIHLDIESDDEENWLEIDRVWSSKTRVRPGEVIELSAALKKSDGTETVRTTAYRVPPGAAPGQLQITFSDANALNLLEWQSLLGLRRSKDPAQSIEALNRIRRNDRLYVRVWRPQQGFRFNTERLPAPPASISAILSPATGTSAGSAADWQSVLEEFAIGAGPEVIRGNVTTKVTVIE